jgi:hypothetical protein
MIMDRFNNRKAIVPLLIGFNTVLWIALWANFCLNSTHLQRADMQSDDSYIVLVVLHRAASPAIYSSRNWSYGGAFVANLPSYFITHIVFNLAFGTVRNPQLYLGTTVAGYELMCWMIVSFLQWYLVARLLIWTGAALQGRAGLRVAAQRGKL